MLQRLYSIISGNVCVILLRRMIWCRFRYHLVCAISSIWVHLYHFFIILIRISCKGFTFSFPMRQHSLNSATLAAWAKSFNLPTVIDQDVVEMLRDSLHKLGHNHIEIVAILNDTTSTLVFTFGFYLPAFHLTVNVFLFDWFTLPRSKGSI